MSPAQPPLTLGAFALATLQAARNTLEETNIAIEALTEVTRPLLRAEMERIYGDVPEDDREERISSSRGCRATRS
jgi:hypothetical protein